MERESSLHNNTDQEGDGQLKGTSSPLKAETLQTNPNALHSDDVAVVHVASRSVTCTHVRGRNLLCASIGAGCVLPELPLSHTVCNYNCANFCWFVHTDMCPARYTHQDA
jgi:hypothetical protein